MTEWVLYTAADWWNPLVWAWPRFSDTKDGRLFEALFVAVRRIDL